MTDGKVITNVIDAFAICSNIIDSAETEVIHISHPSQLVLASYFGLAERVKLFMQRGGRMRGIVDFSYPFIKEIQSWLDIGEDVRYSPQYQGMFMLIGDGRESISSISVDVEHLSIDTPVAALWNWKDDPTYAEYLMSIFETAWKQAIPAAERIEELLKEGPPNL